MEAGKTATEPTMSAGMAAVISLGAFVIGLFVVLAQIVFQFTFWMLDKKIAP